MPALPRIWNVPFPRKSSFIGRDVLLADLRAALTQAEPTRGPQVLYGLGGVGKSQLAIEYAWRHAQDYDLVWWVRADEAMNLAGDYAGLATELSLAAQAFLDQRTIVKAVHRWLQAEQGWLLIVDDASGPEVLYDYLPRVSAGHVLITSRNPDWGEVAQAQPVPPLQQAEASAFLRQRAPLVGAAAEVLADELGELPLALEQAAGYLEQTGRTAAEYLEMFSQSKRELLERALPAGIVARVPVATAWKLAFEQAQSRWPAAADLLNLCAFLAPGDIFRELLRDGTAHLPPTLAPLATNRVAWDDAVRALRRYSLVEAAGDVVAVHRLVQAVARDRLAEDARTFWTTTAVRIVLEAFPDNPNKNIQTWPTCARLLPHATAVVEHAGAIRAGPDTTARLLNKVGLYLRARAQLIQARAVLQEALRLDEATYGPEHQTVAVDLNHLGVILWDQRELAEARQHLERALDIRERVLGPDHPDTALSLNDLGVVVQAQGDSAAARRYYERALAIREKVPGPDHPDTSESLNSLAGVLLSEDDLAGARSYLERALAIRERVLGPDHPDTAICLNNLGYLLLQDQGQLAGARSYLERGLAIRERVLGPDHPDTANSVNNLGRLLQARGDLAGARPYYERALGIRERVLGPNHPATAVSLAWLGSLLMAQGDMAGARTYYERALDIDEKVFGPDHPTTRAMRDLLPATDPQTRSLSKLA